MDDKKKKGVVTGKKKEIIKECKKNFKDPMFVGIDPSYNGFAIVIVDGKGEIVEKKLIQTDSKKECEERIIDLEKEFKFIPNIFCLHSVYIEGPSYSSNGQFILQMGALHYYLRIFLTKKDVKFSVIAPGTLKKFIAGDGRAKKDLMLLKTYKKFGVEFEDDNLCDAYGLARFALEDFQNDTNR
jgi:Holliday junction resolvasome RuvABC endonuclease subunit